MPLVESTPSVAGGGSGTVTNVSSANTAIAVATPTTTPVLTLATLDVIAADGPPAADWSNNSHKITSLATPTLAADAATKAYVDNAITGLTWKASVAWATTAALPANTYANGASGVGATLTANGNGAITIDGNTPAALDRVLVKNEVAGANNGIYVVTTVGTAGTPYVLTRATDFDQAAEITAGDTVPVVGGTTNADTSWLMTTTGAIVVGTTALAFTKFSGVTSVAAADTSIVVAGTASAPTIATGTLDVIATNHAPAADWSNNGHAITALSDLAVSGLTGAVTATRYVGGTAGGPPTTGTFVAGDYIVTTFGAVWVCTAGGTPGTWAQIKAQDPLLLAAGYKGWSWDLRDNTAKTAPATGIVYLIGMYLPPGVVVTNLVLGVGTAAAGTNPTGFFVGLAGPTGTMLGQSNNLNAAGGPTTTGPVACALNATYTTALADSSTGFYYGVILLNGAWGTTQPALFANSGGGNLPAGVALGSSPRLIANGVTGGQTALPGNGSGIAGGLTNVSSVSFFAGVS